MLEEAPFSLDILPSAMMDIVRTQYFYDSLEYGLGSAFRDYIVGEVDKLAETVWRILDMRFDPRRIFAALRETSGE
jgi:hypothetical protein